MKDFIKEIRDSTNKEKIIITQNGNELYFKNGKIDQFLGEIPLDKIVLETDSPYLAPVPHRGKRNESAYLNLIAGKLVDIYGVSFEEIDKITTENAKKIFKI